jgi:hypothetical protein
MDVRTEGEIIARLDHIERYLVQLGAQTGLRYTPFATDPEAFWGLSGRMTRRPPAGWTQISSPWPGPGG